MPVPRRSRPWLEVAAALVVVVGAAEEFAYVRRWLSLASRRWWQEVEHRDRYAAERSLLDVLVPRILARRLSG